MSVVPNSRGAFFADGIFDDSNDRILQNANVFFEDSSTGLVLEMDSITLQVSDAAGVEQYTLSTVSSPAIVMEEPANVYVVDEIDVTGFPDGDISLTWTATYDGYEYTHVQTVAFENTPDMIFVTGLTDTLEDFSIVLGQAKLFTVRARDSIQNAIDGYAVRIAIVDRDNAAVKERVDATLKAAGTGLWTVSHTLTTNTYSADLDRYELYWEMQIEASGSWFEIANSRRPLKVYNLTSDIETGPLTYTSNATIRRVFPGIDRFLEDVVPNQGEREIMLNQKRSEANTLIYPFVKNARIRARRDILELWEAYEVYRLVLLTAHAFSKFAVNDGQLALLDKQIKRIKYTVFSPISTVRVGGRVT